MDRVCKNCKWWEKNIPTDELGCCSLVGWGPSGEWSDKECPDMFEAYDDGLFTGPLFGCIHWEEK